METTLNASPNLHAVNGGWLVRQLDTLRGAYVQHLLYRQTVSELSDLSDRTLADLGLERSMIRSAAREAAAAK